MTRDVDGISRATGPGVYDHAAATGKPSPRVGIVVSLVMALLLGALSLLVMFPAVEHLRSLRDGERAQATLIHSGSCMIGHCQVEFTAGGRTVVATLPVGSSGGKSSDGARWVVRYRAEDPETAVREADLGGGGAIALAWTAGGLALMFAVTSVYVGFYLARRRLRSPAPH